MEGVELALRFAYMPNRLRFCGPEGATKDFTDYFRKRSCSRIIEKDIRRFEGLYPYLEAIASKSGKRFIDYDVVEAYWIGNKLLYRFSDGDVKAVIESLSKRGLPSSIAGKLVERLPSGMVPHHNFNVFYVGVGQVTGAVPTNIENMNSCMISKGQVSKVMDNKLVVSLKPVVKKGRRFLFGSEKRIKVEYLKAMLPSVKVGDCVAVHWGFAPLVLTKKQEKSLETFTGKILETINEGKSHAFETASA